nr:titin homolog [Nicotiana tomentosiformis]
MAEDSELWDVICDGPFVPTKTSGNPAVTVPKTRKEFNDADRKAIKKNFRAKKILVCGISPDEYNRILACQSAKEIREAIQTTHEGTTQVKQSKIDMLTTEYELFRMKDDESIQDMHTRFTYIINELHSLGEIISRNKLVRKILSVLPSSWESKVNAIIEAKDLQKLTIDELVGNLKTYEMKKKKDNERREPKREKNLVLKTNINDSSGEDGDMTYLTRRLQKMDQFKHNTDKAAKRNPVPDKCFKRKNVVDNVVKQALDAWGDSSSESKEDNDHGDSSMISRNLKSYSPKKLMSLANVLIDAYHNVINDKNFLTVELGEAEQSRDDLVVVVVDLKETIESLKEDKDALTEKITNVEHGRDDLVVVVVDLKEIIECAKKDKEVLIEKVASLELERDDLVVVVVDLKETIESVEKEKDVLTKRVANAQLERDDLLAIVVDLNDTIKALKVKSRLCVELEKNKQLQEELGRVKSDLEKSLKWTWSYDFITAMYINNKGNRQGIGFQKEKTLYNPHSKIEKSLTHSIENVYYVNGLKYNLLRVSQICDKGNNVEFVSQICTVTNLVTGEVVLVVKRYKNIYVADFESLQNGDLNCLSDVDDDVEFMA